MVSKLRLQNFRNFDEKLLEFSDSITVIVGPNASGKTNILEALFLLSSGKSFHARLEEEMINTESDLARVKARLKPSSVKASEGHGMDLEAVLTRGVIPGVSGKIARKKFLVNGVARRMIDFAGNAKMVLFAPADMDLVTESPSIRRKFLDFALSQVDREYRRSLLSYEKGLRQRNRLLFRIREEGLSRTQLLFWNQLLIKNGNYISDSREKFINFVNQIEPIGELQFNILYDKSAISEGRLEEYKNEEVAAATTLVGPHRDDFVFEGLSTGERQVQQKRNLSSFGSRGEQRMAVLWLKLAELEYIKQISSEKPTLLLDDIFSELDSRHRAQVMEVASRHQTVITTADPNFLQEYENVDKIAI